MLRQGFDVSFQFYHYPDILLSERGENERLGQLYQAGHLDREIESADDSGRAVFGLEGVANVDVDVCGERALLQNHGVVKRDASWRVEFCNGAWSLACRACVKVGGAERHWIWRDLRRAAECF